MQKVLLDKFNISCYLVINNNSDLDRGYVIKIPNK